MKFLANRAHSKINTILINIFFLRRLCLEDAIAFVDGEHICHFDIENAKQILEDSVFEDSFWFLPTHTLYKICTNL